MAHQITSSEGVNQELASILEYLKLTGRATTKDITENAKGLPKNRAVVENRLLRLFMMDEVMMAREGRAKVWSLNHIRINPQIKPLSVAILPEYNDQGKNTRKFWFDLFSSPKYGDYIYVAESRYVEGEGWNSKGGLVLPIDMVVDYVFHLLKMAIKSQQFRESHSELYKEIENFVKEVSLYI